MAKVLFIQPNYDIDRPYLGDSPGMPVALVELASFIREKGNEVKILDRNLYPDNNNFLRIFSGISSTTIIFVTLS